MQNYQEIIIFLLFIGAIAFLGNYLYKNLKAKPNCGCGKNCGNKKGYPNR